MASWSCLGLVAVLVATAAADPNPEAEKLFRDGRKLLADGKLAEACDAFAASSKIEPSVGTFLNLGDCRAKLGQSASAWAAFVEAGRLARHQRDARQAEADRRSAELEQKLSYLTITVIGHESKLEIDRNNTTIDPTVWGQSVPIDPGPVFITARAPGYDPWSTTITVAPNGDRQIIAVPALHAHPIETMVIAGPTFNRTRKLAIGVTAVGLAALVAGGILALDANALQGDAYQLCPVGQPCRSLTASQESDRAVTRGTAATVVGAAGVVAIGVGVALWFVGKPHETAVPVAHVVPIATPDTVALAVVGSF